MQLKKFYLFSLLTFLLISHGSFVNAATISQGVYHSSESLTVGGYPQKTNILSVNLNQPYTTMDVGVSSPLNILDTTSGLAKKHTQINHHVVGGINASFFSFDTKNPSYLIAKNNEILHLGSISTNYNDFMYTPAAFGIAANQKAIIDRYQTSLTIEHNGKVASLTNLNRERQPNETILYTSSWAYPNTRTNSTGYEVVVTTSKPVDRGTKFGEKIVGKVTNIRKYGDSESSFIPENGYVLSAANTEQVDKLRNMEIGDDVSLILDIDSKWKDAKFMLASGPLLVQSGKNSITMDSTSSRYRERTSHTAVAVDSTGSRIFMVTVDGRQPGYSQGMNLNEFSNYLVSIGAYNAINLDGGGSTTMVTRKYGQVYPTLANRPSDGTERKVSAIIEAISTAPYGEATHISVSQDQEGIVAVGASVGYKVNSVLDQYYNVLPIDTSKLVLESVSNGVGKIENNRFVGIKAGAGTIIAKYDATTMSIPVTVTSTIDSLVASPTEIRIGTGETAKFNVNGISKNQKVIFNPAAVNWTTSSGLGSVNGTTFTAGTNEITGSLIGTFGEASVSIPVTVSNKPLQISGMNTVSGLKAENARASASIGIEEMLQAKEGTASVKLNYDFTAFRDGISAAYVNWTNGLAFPATPKKIGAWVYGDGNNHWLRASIKDALGRETAVDLTAEGGLNWVGWKYVEANIPSTLATPIKLSKIYVAEPSSTKKQKGSIWIDSIQAVYTNQTTSIKSFTPSSSARIVNSNKQFTVTFSQAMNPTFINSKHVYVEDEYGVRQNVNVQAGSSAVKLVVTAPTGGYAKGKSYRLVVTHFAENASNIRMIKDSITEFKVQ